MISMRGFADSEHRRRKTVRNCRLPEFRGYDIRWQANRRWSGLIWAKAFEEKPAGLSPSVSCVGDAHWSAHACTSTVWEGQRWGGRRAF